MKKYLILSSIGVLGVIVALFEVFYGDNSGVVFSSESNNSVFRTNTLTMMYETGVDSGEYQASSDNLWPQEGYTFNETLSKCENGGILTWNNDSQKALMQGNISDRCYIYFDLNKISFEVVSGRWPWGSNSTYDAGYGMTWKEWIDSNFNNDFNVNVSSGDICSQFRGCVSLYGKRVNENDTLVPNQRYLLDSSDYSSYENDNIKLTGDYSNYYDFNTIDFAIYDDIIALEDFFETFNQSDADIYDLLEMYAYGEISLLELYDTFYGYDLLDYNIDDYLFISPFALYSKKNGGVITDDGLYSLNVSVGINSTVSDIHVLYFDSNRSMWDFGVVEGVDFEKRTVDFRLSPSTAVFVLVGKTE